jgi:hypothetical protein
MRLKPTFWIVGGLVAATVVSGCVGQYKSDFPVVVGQATISDIIPMDGGQFLKFNSPETGFRAAVELLTTPRYDDLELDRALRRWSNNGFGAEILAGTQLDAPKPVPYSGQNDLEILLNAMAAAEGYKSSMIADEIKKALKP